MSDTVPPSLCLSQPDVSHVLLVCELLHLRGLRSSSHGSAHAPYDGTGRHPRPRGTSLYIYLFIYLSIYFQEQICENKEKTEYSWIVVVHSEVGSSHFAVVSSSGFPPLLHRLLLARPPLWEDVVWPSSVGCSLYHRLPGVCDTHFVCTWGCVCVCVSEMGQLSLLHYPPLPLTLFITLWSSQQNPLVCAFANVYSASVWDGNEAAFLQTVPPMRHLSDYFTVKQVEWLHEKQ